MEGDLNGWKMTYDPWKTTTLGTNSALLQGRERMNIEQLFCQNLLRQNGKVGVLQVWNTNVAMRCLAISMFNHGI